MNDMGAVRVGSGANAARRLYDHIGDFLVEQRLELDPANFAFAHTLLAEPDGPLATAVRNLTEGGVRLTRRDIEALGCEVPVSVKSIKAQADGLVAQTQIQVENFQDVVEEMRAEAEGFGHHLAASAAELDRSKPTDLAALAQLTGSMLKRVRITESRLERARLESGELRSKLEEARENARRDPLTDLPNRRAFEEAYAANAAAGISMCIAICDVDHFKSVNDRFGHAVGDRVPKAIAEALQQTCGNHLVTRYGGEEFALIFTGIDGDAARVILDTARVTVQTKHYRLRENDAPLGEVTFSAGVSVAETGEMCSTVFHRADRLLYAAKEAGRNQVRGD